MAGVDSNTKLLLHCDGTDASTSFPDKGRTTPAHTVTANGNAQVDTAQQKFGTGSCLLDGTGDFLTVPNHADWNFGTGNFTIDIWARVAVSKVQFVINRATNNPSLALNSSTGTIQFRIAGGLVVDDAYTQAVGSWVHFAISRDGTNCRVFVNGVQTATTGTDSTNITDTTDIRFGASSVGVDAFNGWLDEIRVSKGVARWTTNFTPPTTPYSRHLGSVSFFDNYKPG